MVHIQEVSSSNSAVAPLARAAASISRRGSRSLKEATRRLFSALRPASRKVHPAMDPFAQMDSMMNAHMRHMAGTMEAMDRMMGHMMGSTFGGGSAFGMLGDRHGRGMGGAMGMLDDMHGRSGMGAGGGMGLLGGGMGGGDGNQHYYHSVSERRGGRHGTMRVQSRTVAHMRRPTGDGAYAEERFEQNHVGGYVNGGPHVHETKQLWSNSATGQERVGIERGVGDRARKVVKERSYRRGPDGKEVSLESSHDMMKGMLESDAAAFHDEWRERAYELNGQRAPRITRGGGRAGYDDPESDPYEEDADAEAIERGLREAAARERRVRTLRDRAAQDRERARARRERREREGRLALPAATSARSTGRRTHRERTGRGRERERPASTRRTIPLPDAPSSSIADVD